MQNKLIPVILTAALTSVMTLFAVSHFQHNVPYFAAAETRHNALPSFTSEGTMPANAGAANFELAAQNSVKAVVHVKTTTNARAVMADGNDMFSQLFGQRQYLIPSQMGSGSGVVISPDGYIVTNNHVVADANEVTVTFNDRYTTQAKVVATDPATDIAVLKVEEKNLPFMEFANSDDVKLGQWVLAVGYPFSLDATVTAGIVSAKGRSIGINKERSASAIESFIQTDAAVNPGNSGGALVNTSGQIIGITSAIASPTGSYAGYSYAIPANIVRKDVNDLVKYGSVQRGYMGIQYVDEATATPDMVSKLGLDKSDGVYVMEVKPNSGAAKAGIQKGDFITHIDGQPVNNRSEVDGQIARFQPGDNISVGYLRNGKASTTTVQLTNLNLGTDIMKAETPSVFLGATFRPLNDEEKAKYNIPGGVMLTDLGKGVLSKQTQMHRGFVITGINNAVVSTINDVEQVIAGNTNIQIAGFYPGSAGMYYYGLNNVDAFGGEQ